MKTLRKTIYLSFVCLAMVFASCSSDDDNNDDGGGGGGAGEHFTAKVNGSDFAASTDFATLIGGVKSTTSGVTTLTGQGSTNTGDFINFSIYEYNGPGTYATGDSITSFNGINYGELVNQTTVNMWSSNLGSAAAGVNPGSITITVDSDGNIEGTFSFEGYNATDMSTKNITNGSFKYTID